MARTIRFHLDEHCDPAIAAGLRLHGVDVTTTPEAGLRAAQDEEHITFGMTTGRVVFTQDEDYLRLSKASVEHRGIAFCYQQTRSIGQIIAGLLLIREVYEPDEMVGRVEVTIKAQSHENLEVHRQFHVMRRGGDFRSFPE
ncbi:MAG: DUF5615 family PIN-like protein [Isosphaerales bacterium]